MTPAHIRISELFGVKIMPTSGRAFGTVDAAVETTEQRLATLSNVHSE